MILSIGNRLDYEKSVLHTRLSEGLSGEDEKGREISKVEDKQVIIF